MVNKKPEITIYDLAEMLKISPATISRGLNNNPSINKATRKKIQELAVKMGYRSNTFAQNLRQKRTNSIGVIVPKLDSSFMSSVLAAMEKEALEAGYYLVISQSLESEKKEKANTLNMFNNRVDALVVSLAYDTQDTSHFLPFIKKSIPVVFFDRIVEIEQCTSYVIDNFTAGYDATVHLFEQGCKNVMHITGNLTKNVYIDRLEGYKKALADNNMGFNRNNVLLCNLNVTEGTEIAKKILGSDNKPDGIFVANDTCAAGCMKELRRYGVKIPEDIAIVGFNNDPVSVLTEPMLTTVDYPGDIMGKNLIKTLINHLKGGEDFNLAQKIIIKSRLIVRESSLFNKKAELNVNIN